MKFTAEIEGDVLGVGTDVTKEVKLSESKDVNLAMVRWMTDVIKLTVEGIEKVDAKATLNLRQSVDFSELPVEAKVAQVAMEMASVLEVCGVRCKWSADEQGCAVQLQVHHAIAKARGSDTQVDCGQGARHTC